MTTSHEGAKYTEAQLVQMDRENRAAAARSQAQTARLRAEHEARRKRRPRAVTDPVVLTGGRVVSREALAGRLADRAYCQSIESMPGGKAIVADLRASLKRAEGNRQ